MQTPDQNLTVAAPRPRALYWMLALGLAAILLYFSLRGIDWWRVWEVLRGAKLYAVGAALATISMGILLRAVRWRVLLSSGKTVPIPMVFWATAAGYLGNNLLPARAGELVRTLMISGRSGLGKAFVLTTALTERVSDAIVLIGVSAGILLTLPARPGWLATAARPFAAVGLGGVAAIALLPVFEPFWFQILNRMPIPPAFRGRTERVLSQVIQGIRGLHDRGRLARFLGLTAVIWSNDAVTAMVCAHALGLAVSWPVALLLLAGLGLGSALPSTPGYVGIYQFVAVTVLTPFGIGRSDAIAFVLLYQALGYVAILALGLIGMAKQRAKWSAA
ncbi:MAG: lysylphosphatidylglycerol synthase transmembrane domain-containing protein [Bryobacteraceae bacterium]